MDEVLSFLQSGQVFYVATTEGDKPRVRPFGFVMKYEDRLYFCTGNQKPFFEQVTNNKNIEICVCQGIEWIRIEGEAAFDDRLEVKQKIFELDEGVAAIYQTPGNPMFEAFFLKNAKATFYSFESEPKTINM